jgi:hypothetical protein
MPDCILLALPLRSAMAPLGLVSELHRLARAFFLGLADLVQPLAWASLELLCVLRLLF